MSHRFVIIGSLWSVAGLSSLVAPAQAQTQALPALLPVEPALPALTSQARPGSKIAQSVSAPAVAPRPPIRALISSTPEETVAPTAGMASAPSGATLLAGNANTSVDQGKTTSALSASPERAKHTVAAARKEGAAKVPVLVAHAEAPVKTGKNSATVNVPTQPAAPTPTAPAAHIPAVTTGQNGKSSENGTVAPPRTMIASRGSFGAPLLLPQVTPGAAAGQTEDNLLLAQLDADLSKAQKRLNTAQKKLTEGQRQLGAFTNILQQAMMEAGADAGGLNPFVKVGQRYLGTPYVWGGVSARGFDCSGFIIRVMKDLGYRALPHSAAEQFRYGIPVAEKLLKPGDLVFFANTYKPGISHVGIYLGKRRFIHAANSNDGTIVSTLDSPKWKAKYAGARRLVPVKH